MSNAEEETGSTAPQKMSSACTAEEKDTACAHRSSAVGGRTLLGGSHMGRVGRRVRSILFPAVSAVLLACTILFLSHGHVELMLYDGYTYLGTIESIDVLQQARRTAISDIYCETGVEPQLSNQMNASFHTFYTKTEYLSLEDLTAYLKAQGESNLFYGYVLSVDGVDIAACEREEEILDVLQQLEETLTLEVAAVNDAVAAVKISNAYCITYKCCDSSLRTDADALYTMLCPDPRVCARLAGEAQNLHSSLSAEDGIPVDFLAGSTLFCNNEFNDEYASYSLYRDVGLFSVQESDKNALAYTESTDDNSAESSISLDFCLCTFRTVETVMPYHCVVQGDDTQYPYYCRVTREGTDGLRTTVYEDHYINGELVEVVVSSTEDTVAAVDRIEVHGTKPYPEAGVTTGTFILPLDMESYLITSYFAERRPQFDGSGSHLGIDIVADEWTPIYAADGGVVSWARASSSYGNMVRIDHENGVQTVYAHMVEMTVENGQEVYQGQLIGYVGKTGVASGYHLHFEVRKYGSQQNPLNYLGEFPRKRYW